jgi:cyclic di-GMP phosphodiesterase
MALADTYDAITSKRVYKSQLSHEDAVKIIIESKGSQFDPTVVDAFLALKEDFRQIALRYVDPGPAGGNPPSDRQADPLPDQYPFAF